MSSVYVARQPIFKIGHGLYGYELLYRRSADVSRAEGEETFMSADVIATALLGLGLKSLTGEHVAFINFARDQLVSDSWQLFDPKTVVIELLESVDCDEETVAACKRMVKAGYRLALDDYVPDPSSQRLLDLASVLKLDVLGRSREQLEAIVSAIGPHHATLLAERVETAEVRDICVELGFELFQGYLYSRPETLTKKDVAPGQLAVIRLLNLLQDPATTDVALEAAFQGDVALAYKLLRMVNAAAHGGRGVDSIGHAVRIIGRKALHQWLSILFVASLGKKGDVTQEVALTAITRAKMCELLAAKSTDTSPVSSAFMVGLLSLLDVLLEIPMHSIVARLELSQEVRNALLAREGPLANPLQLIEAYESADWDAARNLAWQSAVPAESLPKLYFDALGWATERVA